MSEPGQEELETAPDSYIDIDEKENEVKEIVESDKEAEYFDASSMSPLTPASMVSIPGLLYLNSSDQAQGCYSSATSIQTPSFCSMGSPATQQESCCSGITLC
jgi:hypothetical protein